MSQCVNPDCLQENQAKSNVCQHCQTKLLLGSRYRAIKILGQGGFGRTFLAVDEYKPSTPVCVIKQFLPQDQGTNNVQKAAELFAQEAKQLDELGFHPQIPALLAYFTQDSRQYLMQEFIDGQNLAQALADEGTFSEQQIRSLLSSLLPVLEFIHSHNVIHRDIKPENLIRRQNGQLVIVDFGAAKCTSKNAAARSGTVIGTLGYVSPEQALGKATFASDIYSLGVTCIHLLTQVEPVDLFDTNVGVWVWQNYLKSPVSNQLVQILEKMIEGASKLRYQSPTEVCQALIPPPLAVPPTQSVAKNTSTVSLATTVGANYTKLRDLLAAGKWEEADTETLLVMLKVSRREQQGWLDDNSMYSFPCTDLRTIDRLWVHYSNGHFGFSVQKGIWESMNKNYFQFYEFIGWRVNNNWVHYDSLSFTPNAPKGYLPALIGQRTSSRSGFISAIASRLLTCSRTEKV